MSSSSHQYPTRLSNNSIPRVKYYPENSRTPFIRKSTPPTLSIPSPVTSNETTPSNSTTSSPISSKSSQTGITNVSTTHYVSISNTTPSKSLSSRHEYDNNFPQISPLSTSSNATPADPKHFNSSKITKVNNPTYSQITASNLQYQPFTTWDQFLAIPSKPNLSNEAHYNQLYLLLKTQIKTVYTSPNINSSCTPQIQTKSSTQSGSSQKSESVSSQLKKIPTENNTEDQCRVPDCKDDSTSSLTPSTISNTIDNTESKTLSGSSKHFDIAQNFTQLKKISTEYDVDDQCRDQTESSTDNTNTSLSFTIFSKAASEIAPLVRKYNDLGEENDYTLSQNLVEQVVEPLIRQLLCIIESVVTHFVEYYQSMQMENYSDYHYPSPNFQHFYDVIFTSHIKTIITKYLLPSYPSLFHSSGFSLSNPKVIPHWSKYFYQLRNNPHIHVISILYFYDYLLFICRPAIPSSLPSNLHNIYHKHQVIHTNTILFMLFKHSLQKLTKSTKLLK